MRLFGLIGYPLTQSFSKKYFDEKFRQEGLNDCHFENFPIPSIEEFSILLSVNPQLEGLAVTIPYKQQVLAYLHSAKHIPPGLNACNCIRVKEGQLYGYNTDCIGFEKSFTPLLQGYHKKALVLGNGGATAAVIYVLKELGIGYTIVSRKIHDDSTLVYQDIDEHVISEHTVIINTTPLGMYPNTEERPPIPYSFISSKHICYDLVYNPAETMFLQKAREAGAVTKNGSDMLVLQAEENWRIWNS